MTTALGINLVHWMHHEVCFDPERPILDQRRWGFAIAGMCKPALFRQPIMWTPGFHGSNAPIAFDDLFLFHLAYFDYDTAMRRQRKRRRQTFIDDRTAHHHQVADAEVRGWMEGWSAMPRDDSVALGGGCAATAAFKQSVLASARRDADGLHHVDTGINPGRLWRIPERFARAF